MPLPAGGYDAIKDFFGSSAQGNIFIKKKPLPAGRGVGQERSDAGSNPSEKEPPSLEPDECSLATGPADRQQNTPKHDRDHA